MTLKALIVDDEFYARNNLKILIDEFCPELKIVGLVESAEQARIIIEKEKPDVVFLDIAMPKEDGFSLLKSYENRDFSVVFTTAYNEYALKAFKENAIDYLEKPISIDDLQKAVQKVMKVHGSNEQRTPAELSELVDEAMEGKNDRISIPTRNGYVIIRNTDIIHLEASDNYTMIYLIDGSRHLSSKNIKVYEENLNQEIFFRTHKSHIINVEHHLKEFSRSEGNMAVLTNGINVPIARRKMSNFLSRINTF
ncbi:LytTR family DNA-binding domain-containing protein [Flavobacteriales bacterium]|nr:LytTR family DNA-binding domain-containing protein [Flavobacteriales bacterium]